MTMDSEDLMELLRLLKKLYEVEGLYCPLKENVRKVGNQILKHAPDILGGD